MKTAIFASDSITINDATFPAQYSITPSNTVMAFVTVDGKPAKIRIEPQDEHYSAALSAARPAPSDDALESLLDDHRPAAPLREDAQPQPAADNAPETVETASAPPAPAAADATPPTVSDASRPVPEKFFIGMEIKGKGWKIYFDGAYDRTRVIFPKKPADHVLETVKKAGFYWSPQLKSWNKKLTHKTQKSTQGPATLCVLLFRCLCPVPLPSSCRLKEPPCGSSVGKAVFLQKLLRRICRHR